MKSLLVIAAILYASWHYTDLGVENVWASIIAPTIFFSSLIALGSWLVLVGGVKGSTDDRPIY